jgi:hypothetical protein
VMKYRTNPRENLPFEGRDGRIHLMQTIFQVVV